MYEEASVFIEIEKRMPKTTEVGVHVNSAKSLSDWTEAVLMDQGLPNMGKLVLVAMSQMLDEMVWEAPFIASEIEEQFAIPKSTIYKVREEILESQYLVESGRVTYSPGERTRSATTYRLVIPPTAD